MLHQVRAGLPYAGRAVHALQPGQEAERPRGEPGLLRPPQAPDPGDLPRGLPAQELAVQRLVRGKQQRVFIWPSIINLALLCFSCQPATPPPNNSSGPPRGPREPL